MNRRTTAALALLLGMTAPVLAAPATGPAYEQAAGLANGRSADAVYDGGGARTAVHEQVNGALQTGGLAVEAHPVPPANIPSANRPALTDSEIVPSPSSEQKAPFFSKHSLIYGGGGAVVGAGVGWLLGGFIGAAIGAVAGFAIGFLLSKLLKHS